MITSLLFFVLSTHAAQPNGFIKNWERDFAGKVSGVVKNFDDLETTAENFQLRRIDLGLSLSSELGVLLFSKEKEKGVELVWERRDPPTSSADTDASPPDVIIGASAQATYEQMLPPVLRVLSEAKASSRVRKKVIHLLYRDAAQLTDTVQTLMRFNRTAPPWVIAHFFKVYHFSLSGDLVFAGTSYDKRLRFRFRVPQVISPDNDHETKLRGLEQRLKRASRHLAEVAAQDGPQHRFILNRARTMETLTLGVSAGLADASAGKGVLLEWVPAPQGPGLTDKSWVLPSLLRSTAEAIENSVPDTKNFELSQIQLNSSRESEVEVLLLSASKGRDIEYHYRRRP